MPLCHHYDILMFFVSCFPDGIVKVNDATVVFADASTSNGVIHVIDTVLMPPEMLGKK